MTGTPSTRGHVWRKGTTFSPGDPANWGDPIHHEVGEFIRVLALGRAGSRSPPSAPPSCRSDTSATVDSLRVFYDSMTKVVKARAAHNDSLGRAHGEPVNAGGAMRVLYQAADVADLPDYLPPVGPQSLLADADDNVWIRQDVKRPSFGPPPPSVYDVVDRQRRLIDRVQIPAGQAVAGFGHGVVYLTSREAWGAVVAKYRIR